jgi:type II secretory pathway pseudopilin PulG
MTFNSVARLTSHAKVCARYFIALGAQCLAGHTPPACVSERNCSGMTLLKACARHFIALKAQCLAGRTPPACVSERNCSGMTLLELIVGLTVTGLVLTAGFSALAVLGDRRHQAEAAMAAVARAANQRAEIAAWLAGAHLVADEGGPEFRGLDGIRDQLPDDDLSFLTTSPTPLGTGETLARLYVDHDEATPERGLTAAFAEWRGTTVKRVEIDSAIAGMDVRYLSGILGQRTWLPSWVSTTIMPAGVEVRLIAAADDSLSPLLRLPITVPLGAGR